jgi:hypothetical protein
VVCSHRALIELQSFGTNQPTPTLVNLLHEQQRQVNKPFSQEQSTSLLLSRSKLGACPGGVLLLDPDSPQLPTEERAGEEMLTCEQFTHAEGTC